MRIRVPTNLKLDKYDVAVIFLSLSYSIAFSYIMYLKHQLFMTTGWDLGIFDQALYTTLFHGKLFYYTVELHVNPSGCFFAIHFSPILFLLLPLYAIHPSATTLLIVKSFALGLAAIPLYLVAKAVLRNKRVSLLVSIAYLLYPPLHSAHWFDFQQACLLPLLIFSYMFFMLRRQWRLCILAALLTLMTIEYAAIIMLLLALYNLLAGRARELISLIRSLRLSKETASLITIVMCIVWFIIAEYVKSSFPVSPTINGPWFNNWKVLGLNPSDHPLIIAFPPLRAFIAPQKALEALLHDFHLKFFYIIMLFGPLLFIPLRSRLCIAVFILLFALFLSNYRPYYMIYPHYPLYILPLIFLSFIDALSRSNASLGRTLLTVLILFTISTSVASPLANAFVREYNLLGFSPLVHWDSRVESLHSLLKLIPRNASVLVQNHVFSHVSNRLEAYVIPLEGQPWDSQYLELLINRSQYVLIDLSTRWGRGDDYVLDRVARSKEFGIYGVGDGVILFKRGYSGKPIYVSMASSRTFIASRDLALKMARVAELDGREVVFYEKGAGAGTVVFGPYTYLLPGTYIVRFSVLVSEGVEGHVATIDVATDCGRVILAKRDVYGFELRPGEWSNVSVRVSTTTFMRLIEFRLHASGLASIYVDRVVVERIGDAEVDGGTMTFNYNQLHAHNASIVNGLMFCPRGVKCVIYGPYAPIDVGKYEVTYVMRIEPSPEPNDLVMKLDVASNAGTRILANRSVSYVDLIPMGQGWYRTSLTLEVRERLRDVEFRLFSSERYSIALAYVMVERCS